MGDSGGARSGEGAGGTAGAARRDTILTRRKRTLPNRATILLLIFQKAPYPNAEDQIHFLEPLLGVPSKSSKFSSFNSTSRMGAYASVALGSLS